MKFKRIASFCVALSLAVSLFSCTGTETSTDSGVSVTDTNVPADTDGGIFEESFTVDPDFSPLNVTDDKSGWDGTVQYSHNVKNTVGVKYTSGDRGAIQIENSGLSAEFGISSNSLKLINSFKNKNGEEYFVNSADAYMTASGNTFFASSSATTAYMNTFRIGQYYNDVHILDLSISNRKEESEPSEPYDLLEKSRSSWSGNDTYNIRNNSGKLTYQVKNNNDPYCYTTAVSFPTQKYNAFKITLSTEVATSCQLFFFTTQHQGFNAQQMVSFTVAPGVEKTYVVAIDGIPGYEGDVKGVRIDCGTVNEEKITISSFEAIDAANLSSAVRLERIFHTYPDKLHEEVRFIATEDIADAEYIGVQTKIPDGTVKKFITSDGATVSANKTADNCIYAAFDIDGAGIFGYILPKMENQGKISIEHKDGYYIINRYLPVNGLSEGDDITIAHRIYNDMTHSFDGFMRQVYAEHNPLENISITKKTDGASYKGYDPLCGAYVFTVDSIDFNEAYYRIPDKKFAASVSITGDDSDRRIYIKTASTSGGLESGALLDENGTLVPIPLQVCKNFCGEYEEPVYYPDDKAYGEIYLPITVKANETKEFTVLNLYQNWGKYPLKQLSSVQYSVPYYHISLGVTETNTIAPYYVNGKDGWVLPDFRALSSVMWTTQPQYYSAGKVFFLKYKNENGNEANSEFQKAEINSAGPLYMDIDTEYLSDNGKIKIEYKHVELPQTDETRTLYEIKLTVLQDMHIDSFKDDLSFTSMNGRHAFYEKLSYLDKNGQTVHMDLVYDDNKADYIPLGDNAPFFCYYQRSGTSNEIVNMAYIIKDHDITVGGQQYDGDLILKNYYFGGLNFGALTLDLEDVTLKAGDLMTLNMVILAWGDADETEITSVLNVRQDTCLSPYTLDVTVGNDVSEVFVPSVRSENGSAEFSISGGDNIAVVRVYGFDSYKKPVIYELVEGQYREYDVSHDGYDGYFAYYDGDGEYSCAFAVDMTNAEKRTFKITQ